MTEPLMTVFCFAFCPPFYLRMERATRRIVEFLIYFNHNSKLRVETPILNTSVSEDVHLLFKGRLLYRTLALTFKNSTFLQQSVFKCLV